MATCHQQQQSKPVQNSKYTHTTSLSIYSLGQYDISLDTILRYKMRKINGSSKSNTHAFVEHRHLFVEKRDDDDDEHKHGDIENIGKRENIQLGTVNTKWGLVRCSKRIIRIIIIAILVTVAVIFVCSRVMSLQGDLNEVSAEEETSSLDTMFIFGQKDLCGMRADCMEEVTASIPIHKSVHNMGDVCESIMFGTHHKTGTVLARRLMRTMCPNFTMGKNFNSHMKPNYYVPGSPFVHFIRDPLEQVIVST